MKRLFAFAALLLVLASCKPSTPTPKTVTPPKELTDPELTINGVPEGVLESGASFKVTVSSKSDGEISLTVDKPSVAVVEPAGTLEYSITAMPTKDETIKIIASQEEKGDFKAATAKASFKVKGSGTVEIPGPDDEIEGTGVSFEESSGICVSPERGMYHAFIIYNNTPAISSGDIVAQRSQGKTICLLEFYLTTFMGGSISDTYLQKVQDCFDAVRDGGGKAIVRFAYTDNHEHPEVMPNPQSEDQEPEVTQVLAHVAQLKPVLIKNEDVLFALQAGFVGTWGEWYYTTHFYMNPKSPAEYKPRKDLTDALLDAVPASRQIQLRTPKFKMQMYDIALKDTLTAETAHNGSIYSRLAGHNDCFGASATDQGTFDGDDTRKFWKTESRYTIMGGETCEESEYCLCPATLKDLEDYHWTYLHDGYREEVLARWQTDGCMGEIVERLGYRFVLQDVHYGAIKAGEPCKVTIRFHNKGYAAPMNPREAWLVWKGSDGNVSKSLLGADPRTWHRGYNAAVSKFTPTTDKGTLYLLLSDPLLPDKPAYCMAFANKDVFDAKTGYNKLFEVK
ncbi:MAG: DUF4832 domain-containing protein [Bacteroidales bacterium]|nr:DUF4832 domain-containing protein [Bacteroidales bacterium]